MSCRKIKAAPVNPFNYDANINTTLSKEMPGPTLLGSHLSVKFKNYNCKFYSSPQMPLLFSYRGEICNLINIQQQNREQATDGYITT